MKLWSKIAAALRKPTDGPYDVGSHLDNYVTTQEDANLIALGRSHPRATPPGTSMTTSRTRLKRGTGTTSVFYVNPLVGGSMPSPKAVPKRT